MYLNDNSALNSMQLLLVGVAIKVLINPAKTMATKNMNSAIDKKNVKTMGLVKCQVN